MRAVLEGVAYGLRDCLDLLVEVGAAPTIGRVSGGGARSDLWLRIVASVLELPLERTAVDEGAAFGAALLGGRGGRRVAGRGGGGGRGGAAHRRGRAGGRTGSSRTARVMSASGALPRALHV